MAAVAAVGMALGVAQTLFAALQTKEVKEMCSMFRCKGQLEKLEDTVSTIKAVLLDIDSKRQGLTHEGQVWVEKLKDAVYDIDDLLDEFATIVKQRNQMRDAKFSKKVSHFFSRYNKYFIAFIVSQEISMLREKLDAIAKNHADFGFTDVSKPVNRRQETCSKISDLNVIGRDDDKEAVVGMLLSDSQNVSFVNIVGIGGLGKTTLAQLVYNDERVEGAFSERIWVCVSEDFGIKEILGKILGREVFNLEAMQREVRTLLGNKKYLLVLDDVWNESHDEWLMLKPFLISDVSGSKIIVTTRSKNVATSIGEDSVIYELEGLSKEDSWSLFKRIAFGQRKDQAKPKLVNIGKDIVKKCANVPLSIRVIASLLHTQEERQWQLFSRIDLAELSYHGRHQNSIMPTLMFSYYHLSPELKSCFSFCSLFPKDRIIEKELLISLWLAEGLLVTSYDVQNIEDVGEQYVTILLNRCFFQDIELDEHGDVYSFKMHDLMRDLALEVAGNESLIITPATKSHSGKKIRHLYCNIRCTANLCSSDTLRTYIQLESDFYLWRSSVEVTTDILKCRHLRVLSLSRFGIRTIPGSLGKLLHLRYLDLSGNCELEMLPKSITKLHNLQILKLSQCINLKELPEDMSQLVNLRTLDIHNCIALSYMPRGMSKLTNIRRLTQFVVGGEDSKQMQGSKLVDLQSLKSLKGDLCIRVQYFCPENMPHATEGPLILTNACLKNLEIKCGSHYCHEMINPPFVCGCPNLKEISFDQSEVHETLLKDLCPNDDITRIGMAGYEGTKLPRWASMMVLDVNGLQHVRSLSQFLHLKVVELKHLANVEYIENNVAWVLASRADESRTFFPILEKLVLLEIPKLKGWWKELRWIEMEGRGGCLVDANGDIYMKHAPCFPRLQDLSIISCESMTYFPPCPHVKRLRLFGVNEALTFCMKGGVVASAASSSSSTSRSRSSSSSNLQMPLYLEKLKIDNGRVMNSVLKEFVGGAIDVKLRGDEEIKSMDTLKEGFERLYRRLRSLKIEKCDELDLEEEKEGMAWKYLQSLSTLELNDLPKMVKLPKGLRYLTSLQFLHIDCNNLEELGECIGFLTSLHYLSIACSKLKSLPESMRHLTSLTTLQISDPCDELRE
ncbi:putative disease resistance protein RGA1 [Bienertia sinuspersici]